MAPCAELAGRLLLACPQLTILATSRQSLALDCEHGWPVPPLSVPAPQQPVRESEAVALFVERARAVQPSFDLHPYVAGAVAEICTATVRLRRC